MTVDRLEQEADTSRNSELVMLEEVQDALDGIRKADDFEDLAVTARAVAEMRAEVHRLRTESAGLRAAVETFREALENPDTYEELGWGGHVLADAELAQAAAEVRAKGGTS